MKLNDKDYKMFQAIGKIALVRIPEGFRLPSYVMGQIVSYDPVTHQATVQTLSDRYPFEKLSYDKELSKVGTWCYKNDLTLNTPDDKKEKQGTA